MAKQTATRTPVAGQAGFDPFKTSARSPELPGDEREIAPQEVRPKPKRETAAGAMSARVATWTDLLNHLTETGTPARNLANARAHFADQPDATAEKCFRFLESTEDRGEEPINVGTLRKAGKWLWGATWEVESAAFQAPAEEIKKLREQVASAEGQLAAKNSEIGGLRYQLGFLKDRNTELAKQIDWLKAGRSPEELQQVGIGSAAAAASSAA